MAAIKAYIVDVETKDALSLAESYIKHRVLTRRHINDLLQLAITPP